MQTKAKCSKKHFTIFLKCEGGASESITDSGQ